MQANTYTRWSRSHTSTMIDLLNKNVRDSKKKWNHRSSEARRIYCSWLGNTDDFVAILNYNLPLKKEDDRMEIPIIK